MIGLINGRVAVLTEKTVILESGGVGWELTCAPAVLRNLEVGGEATLYCEVRARENDLSLIGFATLKGREIFRKLRTAPGVGAAGGLSLLDSFSEEALISYILAGDAKALTAAPGIGRKRAEQIIAAVRESFADFAESAGQDAGTGATRGGASIELRAEAHKALLALGYSSPQAERALLRTAGQVAEAKPDEDSETQVARWVRAALQELAL